MAGYVRNRTISPNSRKEKGSERYKIDCKKVSESDVLVVNIDHKETSFQQTFRFNGQDLTGKNSIHFEIRKNNDQLEIHWSGANPIG